MRAAVYINGRLVGEVLYDHPTDEGVVVPLPSAKHMNEITVLVTDDDGHGWFACDRKVEMHERVRL
jgi:hypothetical protein